MAFFEKFHPDSIISIKGYDANMEVAFKEASPPKAIIDAIFSCCEGATIELACNTTHPAEVLPDKNVNESMDSEVKTAVGDDNNVTDQLITTEKKKRASPKKTIPSRNESLDYELNQEEGIRKIDLAKSICNIYCSQNDRESKLFPYISILRKDIKKAEIGNLILDAINFKGTYDEEKAYYNTIKRVIQNKNLKLEGISLGTTKDGTKTITVADLFSNKIKE